MNEEKKAHYAKILTSLYEGISSDISKLKMKAYKSREPLKFADRFKGECCEVCEGQRWGEKLFDCAWFEFSGEIKDADLTAELALKIDLNGELFVADEKGEPLEGLTCKSSSFCESLGKPVKRFYTLTQAMLKSKKFSVWADCGLNDLFGRIQGGGRVACARLVKIDRVLWNFYYNYEHVFDWLFALDENSEKARELEDALENATSIIEGGLSGKNISSANEILEKALYKQQARPALKVYAIGHAHMDLAWLWPIRETKRKLARTFSTALSNIKKYPNYIYGASQPQAYEWMKEDYPELYLRIKDAVKKGSIEPLGAMWVEPDCNLPSGESFIRQILYGRQFFKEQFGIAPDFFWIPDSFGYSPQLPQILAKSGVKYFVTQKLSWNMINKFPYHSFWWRGLDKSRVLAHMLPEETYNSPAAPRSLIKIEKDYAQKDVSDFALMAFGIGDGGGGPGVEHLERVQKNAKVCGLAEIRNKKVAEFLKQFETQADKFPVWDGDLYLEKHQGTYTTQGANKKHNRVCETELREVEFFMYLLDVYAGQKPDKAVLDEIWREVLLYQFHDILPGSSIERVYTESCARYEVLEKKLREIKSKALEKLRKIFGASAVFNATSWSVELEENAHKLHIPQLGYALNSTNSAQEISPKKVSVDLLEDEFLRVKIDENGNIKSLFNKVLNREFIAPSKPSNLFNIYSDKGDAWDFGYAYRDTLPTAATLVLKSVKDGKLVLNFAYQNSRIVETLSLQSGELKIDIECDWHDLKTMPRLVFNLNFDAEASVSEVAFGSYLRATNDATKWRYGRIETPAHQWVAMCAKDCGLAVLNNGKYGWRLKDNAIECAILRCVPRPGAALVEASDVSPTDGAESSEYADIGKQNFSLSVLSFNGALDRAFVSARARKLNATFDLPQAESQAQEKAESFVKISNNNIELVALKPAQSSDMWIARFVNLSENPAVCDIDFMAKPRSIKECDLAENPLANLQNLDGISFAGFEIKTFMLG